MSEDAPKAHTLLVHGGSHGSWCWNAVIEGLQSAGVSAYAFDLPRCGADNTPRADLRLTDSVAALLTAIDNLPPGPVTVVGHSIGGWLLPYAAAERQRVTELVYVAAVTLRRGERGIDMIPEDRRPTYFDLAAASEDNSILGEFEPTWRRFFGSVDETTARSWYARLTPQPFGPYLDPVAVGVDDVAVASRYIGATRERNFSAAQIAAFADKVGVELEMVEGDHCVMLTDPDALVSCLLGGGLGISGQPPRDSPGRATCERRR